MGLPGASTSKVWFPKSCFSINQELVKNAGFWSPNSDFLNQNLHFNKIPRCCTRTIKFDKFFPGHPVYRESTMFYGLCVWVRFRRLMKKMCVCREGEANAPQTVLWYPPGTFQHNKKLGGIGSVCGEPVRS